VQALLQNRDVRFLSFSTAEAYTRIYPDLVRQTLPQGVLDMEKNVAPTDVSLIASTNRVLVRCDLHPEIVYLLLKAMQAEHSEQFRLQSRICGKGYSLAIKPASINSRLKRRASAPPAQR
jgi:hypothetical protein